MVILCIRKISGILRFRNCLSITFLNAYFLSDRKNIVFGKLVHGHEVLKKVEDAGHEDGRPAVTVKICNSGELSESGKHHFISIM